MMRIPILAAALLASGTALAQSDAAGGNPSASALDLSVPKAPIEYRSAEPAYRNDPPGTFYGDKSGPLPSTGEGRAPDGRIADVIDDKVQVHGAVAAGVGYSSQGGNSNWQGATINLTKDYNTDEGRTRRVGLNISVGRSEGPGYYGYGPGYYGPGYGFGPGYYRAAPGSAAAPGPGWGTPPPSGW